MTASDYTSTEVAEILGVTPGRVRQMYLGGELEGFKRGRDLFFSSEAVEAARRRKTKPGPEPKVAAQASPAKNGRKRAAKKKGAK